MSFPDNSKALTVEIALDFPIKVGGVEASVLTLRRPKNKDVQAMELSSKKDGAKEADYLSNLLQITPAEFAELDMSDYEKILEAHSSFRRPRSES